MWTLSDEVQYLGSRLQSRRNALKHGLTAETVIEPLENPEEYRVFEEAIVSEYLPQTPVEQGLVHRLASLFWRLRRATSIEIGLLRMQSGILDAFQSSRQNAIVSRGGDTPGVRRNRPRIRPGCRLGRKR